MTRVILLSAGYGKRLKPLTDKVPKCLIKINGKPLLEIWIEKLLSEGFGPILINTHYKHEMVYEFVRNSKYSQSIALKYEKKLLGTGGTLIENIDFYNSKDGLLIHADNYCEESIKVFKDQHFQRPASCLMTMLTFLTNKPEQSGIIETNKNNIVINFNEKVQNPPGNLANGAIYFLSAQILDFIKKFHNKCENFSEEIIPNFLNKIYSYKTDKFFRDIGDVSSYNEVNKHILKRKSEQ